MPWKRLVASGGGSAPGTINWGDIGGLTANQADLIALLDEKLDLTGGTVSGTLTLSNLTASRFLTLDASKNVISPTAATATALLDAFVGDSGSGGTKGLVPAPASGDAAANKYLKANGTWATVSGSGISGPVSSTDNAQARWNGTGGNTLQDGKWIEDDDGRITVDIGNTATGATYGTRWTATLTGTAGAIHAIERLDVTTAGSGAGAFVLGRWVRLLAGYTGGGMCAGDWVINNCASTGTDLNGGGGNMGYRSVMGGSGGHSACYYGDISSTSTRMYGVLIDIEAGGSSGVGVGYSTSVHPGSGTYKAACFYGKLSGSPGQVPGVSAAAVLDNGATTFSGLVVQDNGTTMFEVADGSNIICGAQSALATSATNGFTYIPTCAGVPSGVPTAYTGKVAMVFDSTNNNLYLYNGAWKKTTTFA